jgi:hypothetical protein
VNTLRNLSVPKLSVALLHYPVKNKNGEIITSAVTNLDLHDIARTAKTYGIDSFFVVTPLDDQKALVEKIVSHWTEGWGGEYNPKRKTALHLIRITSTLDQAVAEIEAETDAPVRVVVTCAAQKPGALKFKELRDRLRDNETIGTYLLAFGTAWGLTDEFLQGCDFILEPVQGAAEYNHLPVRAAAAIVLNRLLGNGR